MLSIGLDVHLRLFVLCILDAKKLATLLFLDQVPTVHVPNVNVRSWRSFIEFRHRMVAKRTRAKNSLRSLLRGHGVICPGGRSLWTQKGLAWLMDVALPAPEATIQRDILLDELAHLTQQIQRVEKHYERHRPGACRCAVVADHSRCGFPHGGGLFIDGTPTN